MTWVCLRSSLTSLSRRQRPPTRSADWLRSGRLGIGWGHPLSGTKDWMGPPALRYQGNVDGPSRPFGPGRRRPGAARAIPISRPASPPRPLGPPGWVLTRERRRTAHPPAAPASRSAFSASTARATWAATSPPGMRNAQAAFVAIPPRAAAPAHSISEVRLRGSRGTSR